MSRVKECREQRNETMRASIVVRKVDGENEEEKRLSEQQL